MHALDSIVTVIPDIHGDKEALQRSLIEAGHATASDSGIDVVDAGEIVFTGDFIDRGPDSVGVLATLVQVQDSTRTEFLGANHEIELLVKIHGPNNTRRKLGTEFDAEIKALGVTEDSLEARINWVADQVQSRFAPVFSALKSHKIVDDHILASHAVLQEDFAQAEHQLPVVEQAWQEALRTNDFADFSGHGKYVSLVGGRSRPNQHTAYFLDHQNIGLNIHGHVGSSSGVQRLREENHIYFLDGDIRLGSMDTGWGYIQYNKETKEVWAACRTAGKRLLGKMDGCDFIEHES